MIMRKMKDSGVEWLGNIPEEWDIVRAKNVFTNHKHIVGDKEAEYERLALTLNGVLKRQKDDSKGLQSESFSTYQILNEDELVFKMIDLENISTSRVGYSPYTGIVSPVYIVFNNKKYTKYGYYYFYNMWQRTIFNRLGNDGVRSALNASDMLNLPFPKITELEAKKIADFLDDKIREIDAIIIKTKESIDEYKKYKRTVITETVTKGLDEYAEMQETQHEHIGAVPKHWEIKKIKYVLSESGERTKTGKEEPLSMSQKWGLIPTREMDVIPNMASSFDNCKIVHVNDLVFNKLKAHLGVFAKSGYEGLVSPDYAVYQAKNNDNMLFLEYVFKTPQYISQFIKYSKGVAQGLTRLYTEELFSIYIAMPPKEEQDRITEVVKERCAEIDTLIAKKEAFVEEMETYKKSLIYEYVTGKKEVV